jgi:hypothetical protein
LPRRALRWRHEAIPPPPDSELKKPRALLLARSDSDSQAAGFAPANLCTLSCTPASSNAASGAGRPSGAPGVEAFLGDHDAAWRAGAAIDPFAFVSAAGPTKQEPMT